MWPQHQRSVSGIDEHLIVEFYFHIWFSWLRCAVVYALGTEQWENVTASKILYLNWTLIWFSRWSGSLSACWFTSQPLVCCETWLSPPLMFRNHFPCRVQSHDYLFVVSCLSALFTELHFNRVVTVTGFQCCDSAGSGSFPALSGHGVWLLLVCVSASNIM